MYKFPCAITTLHLQKIKPDKGKGKFYTFVGKCSGAALEIVDKEPREDGQGMSFEKRVSPLSQNIEEKVMEIHESAVQVKVFQLSD